MSRLGQDHCEVAHGVVYGTGAGEALLLDIYRQRTPEASQPAVVLIHGGGMWTGSRTHMEASARHLAQAGFVTFSIDYRLVDAATGQHRWPAQIDDVQLAVRWVRAHAADYGVDATRVGAFGWSAGGQLAALLGARETRDLTAPLAGLSSRAACVVAIAPDIDLAAYTEPPALHEVVALLGGTHREVPEQYRDASPLTWIDRRTAPFLVIHGDQDDVVPIEQSRRLMAALHSAKVDVQYLELAGAGHHGLEWSQIGSATLAFFDHHLRPRGA
jgi:acetyl esterase/lipase